MKKAIMPYLLSAISSDTMLSAKRALYAAKRVLLNRPPVLDVFLKVDDPYSYLLLQSLSSIKQRFAIDLEFHVVLAINPEMYPKLELWKQYSRYDAYHLASLYKMPFPEIGALQNFDEKVIKRISMELASLEQTSDFLAHANKLLTEFWRGTYSSCSTELNIADATLKLISNQKLLASKGHYQGAMTYFEGEWYWGIDRLDHLEARLIEAGMSHKKEEVVKFKLTYADFCQTPLQVTSQGTNTKPLVLYWSARSPYSYIGLERALKLAKHYQLPLNIKPVMPMMMRGMNVPEAKKMYIFLDTKREAKKLDLEYGFVADPLGAAVERCYALIDYAQSNNKLTDFLLSFARGVNVQGIRAESDKGLATIVNRCGLDWHVAKQKLLDQSWRAIVEANLGEMYTLGCWGVPTFRYGNTHFWGQDRLYLLEKAIQKDLLDTDILAI